MKHSPLLKVPRLLSLSVTVSFLLWVFKLLREGMESARISDFLEVMLPLGSPCRPEVHPSLRFHQTNLFLGPEHH